jgi:hypothetical protein
VVLLVTWAHILDVILDGCTQSEICKSFAQLDDENEKDNPWDAIWDTTQFAVLDVGLMIMMIRQAVVFDFQSGGAVSHSSSTGCNETL